MLLQSTFPKTASRQNSTLYAFASSGNRPQSRAASGVWARRRAKTASGKSLYNYFRDYDPATGRYVQSDPIGLEGGLNTYAYVEGRPLISTDSRGLWSVSFGGYFPYGGEINFGRDKNSGGGFFGFRGGVGFGGGIKWDPNGTRPGSREDECDTGGWGGGVFGDIQFNGGPLQASLQSNAGINFPNRIGKAPRSYGQLLTPSYSFGDSWGFKAEAATGAELTFFSPKRPGNNPTCVCK